MYLGTAINIHNQQVGDYVPQFIDIPVPVGTTVNRDLTDILTAQGIAILGMTLTADTFAGAVQPTANITRTGNVLDIDGINFGSVLVTLQTTAGDQTFHIDVMGNNEPYVIVTAGGLPIGG